MELKRSRKKVLIKRIIGYLLLFFIPILLTATIIYFYDNLSSKSNIEEKSKQKKEKEETEEPVESVEPYNNELPEVRTNYNNQNIMARIEIPNMNINNYVTRTTDNSYYLNYSLYNTYDQIGAPFFDYRNTNLNSDKQLNIYAHNTQNEAIYDRLLIWANDFDKELAKKMEDQKDYFIRIFEIERKDCDRVRKDFSTLSTIWNEISYFFDFNYTLENFKNDMPNLDIVEAQKIVKEYIENYDTLMQNHDDWFNSLKSMAEKYGYCINNKEFNPEIHKGKVADFVAIFRYLITGRKNSPDLFSVMKVLGKDESIKRLDIFNK